MFPCYSQGGLQRWKRVETSARVCLRDAVFGRVVGEACSATSSSSRSPGRTSSLIVVSRRLLGEMERFQRRPLRLASTGHTTRWRRKGCEVNNRHGDKQTWGKK